MLPNPHDHPRAAGAGPSRVAGLVCAGLAAACASYPARTAEALGDFQRGHLSAAIESYADPDVVGSVFLSGAEAGTVALAAGEWELAREHFDRAAEAAADIEGRALAGSERLGEGLLSWAWNDTTQAYEGEGFERVYLHCGLALTYLAQGRLDAVYVEARRSNQLLEAEETLYEKRYQAGGWGHLISAVAYELLGELDQAYIDYRRMEEKGVGTELAGRALVRIATRLRRTDELAQWEERYGHDPGRDPDAASVVVLAGVGLGPFKVEAGITLPTGDGLFQMAAPAYQERPQPVSALRLVQAESGASVRTDVVERVTAVAQENLSDRLLWTATKSVARGLLKRELTQHLGEEYGLAGWVAGDLFTLFSERADLRAWLTLPDTWQACRLFVPPGVHTLTLEAIGGAFRELGSFELEPGETLVVIARSVGTQLYAYPIGGRLLTAPPQAAVGESTALETSSP